MRDLEAHPGSFELPHRDQDEGDAEDARPTTRSEQHRTACFNCRASRQKCDRKDPCSRCAAQNRPCRYPLRSNRGRRQGATNKPDTVEKLLSRINQSAVRDEVIAAIVNSSHPSPDLVSPGTDPSSPPPAPPHPPLPPLQQQSFPPRPSSASENIGTARHNGFPSAHSRNPAFSGIALEAAGNESLVSPLHIVAGAITANTGSGCDVLGIQRALRTGRQAIMAPVKDRLTKYFASHPTLQRDWEVLAAQSVQCTFKLETETCDPLASRLIDEKDVALYFQLFFKMRNPFVGLLDETLHTPEYVYSASFTLFSVICALGCAVSLNPRDRALYPVLLSLAIGNISWCVAATVKSLEIIQAIINIQFWAPISARQSDDPYWLYLVHAVQLAREIGIDRPATIAEHVRNTAPNAPQDYRARLFRNYERTWLTTFIADKSFGIITGRSHCVGWKEISTNASGWWKKPMTEPSDRMISGIIEIRGQLLEAHERRKGIEPTPVSILNWHTEAHSILTQTRHTRCVPDDLLSSKYLPILSLYMDHSLLVLSAQALRDIAAINEPTTSTATLTISRRTLEVATRSLDLVLTDRTMCELLLGFHNNQYIMICHSATEILRAIQRGGLTATEVSEAAGKVLAVPGRLERVVKLLPAKSAAHLYLDLARFLACQVELITTRPGMNETLGAVDQASSSDEWWGTDGADCPDFSVWLDMGYGYIGSEQPNLGSDEYPDTQGSPAGDLIFH